MTSKLTRERIELIANFHRAMTLPPSHAEIEELARMALAAMDSEPHTDDELSNLLWYSQEATCHSDPNYYCEFQRLATPGLIAGIIRELHERRKADSEPVADVVAWSHPNEERKCDIRWRRHDVEPGPLYRHAQPAPERDQVRSEHAEWSQATFGNVGPIGPLKHLSKEALEAAAEPGDLSEWADMQFLLWDAQRRAGITDEQITQAMIDKLAVNKQRSWPEPKDGEPRLHIKEQPAPVVPVVPVVPATLPCSVELKPGLIIGKGCKTETLLTALRRRADYNADIDAMTPEERAEHDASIKAFKAMLTAAPQLPGSEPATVPGKWIPVSERMPSNEPGSYEYLVYETLNNRVQHDYWNSEGEHSNLESFWNHYGNYVTHWMPLPAAPQEVKGE